MDNSFFASYLERLENLHQNITKEIRDLPPEAMDWVPGPEMNSMAVLLAHTAGSLRFWIGDIGLGEPSGRIREQEFQTKGVSGAILLGRLDAVLDYARGALPRMHLENLEEERRTDEDKVVTRGWALLHALEHGALHLGQIQLTAQMWRADNA